MLGAEASVVYPVGYRPPRPETIDDLALPESFLENLVLKRIYNDLSASAGQVAQALRIPFKVVQVLTKTLEDRKEIAIVKSGQAGTLGGSDFSFAVTPTGRIKAEEESARCSYVGPCPVPLAQYSAMILAQKGRSHINMQILKEAFSDLVIDDDLLKKIGPAIINTGAVFFYGPPGTGKTSVAENMIKVYKDSVLVPYALYAEGEVIVIHDPALHVDVSEQPDASEFDIRWVLCERPSVVVGGELTEDNLELQRDPNSGIYKAPISLLANNGILIVDDFGRQKVTPAQLLNRWIVPLSRDIDFLTLANATKFQVPFDAKVCFSTNLPPEKLGDEAFFRRIPNKVYIGEITAAAFDQILNIVTKIKGIRVDRKTADLLKEILIERGSGDLRPYFPMDFVRIFLAILQFEEEKQKTLKNGEKVYIMDEESVLRIADIYFAQDVTGEASWETQAG